MLALLLSAPLALCQTATMSARDYYNVLHEAGDLDRTADEYVCFYKGESNPDFFTFILSKLIRESMKAGGTFSKLTKAQQDAMKKDSLIERGYAKDIPFPDLQVMSKHGDSWVSDDRKLDKDGNFLREKLTVDWQTLRFKRSIKTYRADSTLIGEVRNFGKCEVILPSYH
jgi:hypothetical protein